MPLYLSPPVNLKTTPGGMSMGHIFQVRQEARRGEACPKPPHSQLAVSYQQQSKMWAQVSLYPLP